MAVVLGDENVMAEEQYPHRGYEIRDRLETVNDRIVKAEGRQEGHEAICALRYTAILKELAEMRTSMMFIAKMGMIAASVLFSLELGRATFPVIFDLLTKVGH